MVRASKLIRELRLTGDAISDEQLACAAWASSVGKTVAAHTRPVRMVRSRLVVEVEDAVWQRQMFTLTPQILGTLAKNLGAGFVQDVEFRVVPRRIEPRRATAATTGLFTDEADGIADPVMRSIYRASRKKAHA